MNNTLVLYGAPILLGFVCGYFFAFPVVVVLTLIAVGIGVGLLYSTRNAELGSLIGFIAAIEATIFLASLWITVAIVSGFAVHVDLSWLFRLERTI
jgi:hypothetical protein